MAFNYNYVPWLSLLGIIGAAIGYVVGGGRSGPRAMYFALVGLLIGTVTGMLVRIGLRYRERIDNDTTENQDTSRPNDEKH
jgi:hypothetical protein